MNRETSVNVPWAQPDACWQKASLIIVRRKYATRRRDGELVQNIVRCVRQLERASTDRAVRRVALNYPDVYWALRLHEESSSRVLELQARVLAGQSDQVIAKQLGLPRRTVTAFIAMFYDVRPRIKANSWICRVAIGLPLDQPPSVESLLLLHAWHRGSEVIEPWLDYLQHQEQRHDLSTEVGRQRAWIELLIQVQQLPFDAQTLRSLWKVSLFSLVKTPKTVRSASVEATVSRNRARILAEIGWNDADSGAFEDSPNPQLVIRALTNNSLGGMTRAG